MKQIIVAIDFSKCSIHALEYAVQLSNTLRTNIIMVWVDSDRTDESMLHPVDSNRKEITTNFDQLIEKYSSLLEYGQMSYKIRKGKVHIEVANQAKYSDAMMVIAGTHGVSGFEEFWIGSNAYRIVTYAPCPVITIRTSYKFGSSINHIVIPIDSTLETRQKIPFATKLSKYFDAEIHVLSLYTTSIRAVRQRVDNYAKQVAKYLDDENVKYTLDTVDVESITKSIIDYTKKVDGDIIAIMTEQETTTANLFLGAYAQQMVNHSPIPVLNIHAKEYIRIQSR